ncbi:ABC transporter ATP-binding protein [Patescibacteria group bacterium]|nr:ABC transporter ATP-binding protein [Patescibacteria group bacterium]MBP9710550.1 ABC transporter ATP-binding protein [Patescibacteria group bacterium]
MNPSVTSSPEQEDADFGWLDLCRAYWSLLGEQKWRWLFLTLLLFVISFYALVPPLLMGKMVDFFIRFTAGSPLAKFYLYASVLGISFVVVSFTRLSLKNVLGDLQSEVTYQIKVRGFERLMDFSLAWHLNEGAGTKAQKMKNGVEAYTKLHQYLTNEIMRSAVAIIGGTLVFLFLRPRYVLFFLIYTLVFWVILRYFYKRIQAQEELFFASTEQASGLYVEGLSNVLTIKTTGANAGFKQHVASREEVTKLHELTMHKLSFHLWKTFQTWNGICYGLFLLLVGRDVIQGQISPGSLVIFYGYLENLIGNASDMMATYENVQHAKVGVGRMMKIFWTKTVSRSGTKKFPKQWEGITLQSASFAYESGSTIATPASPSLRARGTIQDLSLTIPHGSKIGIVGKTGSGKSTLAKILVGLYSLSSGEYKIDRTSFYDLTHTEQTKHIAFVLQETEVFHLSFEENITLMRDISPELVTRAIRIAQLEELVDKLPEGLNTLVGEKGYHLSGGERQRLGIARAICKDAPIIILDEATSSVDGKTELLIQQALEKELKDKTIISIAHRISTLQKTDQIYVFDTGKIVEQGTYKQLSANKKSLFYSLYQEQAGS